MKMFTNIPRYVEREIEEIQKLTLPIMKKTRKYSFLAVLIIPISILNLLSLVFFTPFSQEMFISTLIFAAIGALGFAFQKEVRYSMKEIQKVSISYMKERVEKSRALDLHRQRHYIELLTNHPTRTLNIFQQFLEEENRQFH
ncbi:hypothetical protein CJ195_10175 [Bacillus sp. UMB0899]|uniref:DUF5392 family protein n=1 Tax=Metabacillus schmidteae TaxID=2730405 RepID=UPI000C7FFF2F|nr:DUF5392 family protein [Metabacillus schmidteae]PMC37954.1 hypothetical protein CJ195_10175 [Bacillus sp. UMB0899]